MQVQVLPPALKTKRHMNRLKGFLRLSRIPKSLVQESKNGEKGVWISIAERREKGQYGDTHTMTIWDAENGKAIYIADLRPETWEEKRVAVTTAAAQEKEDDGDELPF